MNVKTYNLWQQASLLAADRIQCRAHYYSCVALDQAFHDKLYMNHDVEVSDDSRKLADAYVNFVWGLEEDPWWWNNPDSRGCMDARCKALRDFATHCAKLSEEVAGNATTEL